MDEFSKRLQKLFDFYDLNASAFADKIDVGRASISHLLSGRNKPSLDFVMRVVKTFPEVELYWLLNGKGSFPKKDNEAQSKMSTLSPTQENKTDSQPDLTPTQKTNNTTPNGIERIVIFYKNGSFKTYTPE
jgi:plasmid maintenance system antidote protein VapI